MPDLSLDPSALTFTQPSLPTALSIKGSILSAQAAQKPAKTSSVAPRIDLEPLYANLKSAIGEYWTEYKEAISLFVLGQLNENELSLRTDHFLTGDPSVEHLHNQLIAGIFANVGRDLPEPGVAPWVSANDKPVVLSKPTSGDAAEHRLKTEVMQLPSRDRRRLKDIAEPDVQDSIPSYVTEYNLAKQFRTSEYVPPSVGGKTNWDLEIRKRFQQPLAAESGEFPDAEVIQGRMTPICYGESLPNGAGASCAQFMATATEHFIKEMLSVVYGRTRSNMPGGSVNGIGTHRFKKQLHFEEDAVSRGEIVKVPGTGLLPVEVKETANRPSLAMHDMKLALDIGDVGLGQFPLVISRIMTSYQEGEYEAYQERKKENRERIATQERLEKERLERVKAFEDMTKNGIKGVNGIHGANGLNLVNGVNGMHALDNDNDDEDWGWDGGSTASRAQLNSSLDQCLAIGL